MVDLTTEELVCLHLAETGDSVRSSQKAPRSKSVPLAMSTPGISEAVGSSETLSGNIELLATLSTLKSKGLVRERQAHVRSLEGTRNAYDVTESGQELATEVRDRISDETVHLDRGGQTDEVPLADLDEFVEAASLAGAVSQVEDGVVRMGQAPPADRLVDREEPLDELDDLAADARSAGRGVLITGTAGIGKTTLVEAFLDDLRDEGTLATTGTAWPDSEDPYHPFRHALEDVPNIDDPFDTVDEAALEDAETYEDRRAGLFTAVAETLVEATDDRLLVVFLDELHEADRATLALFAHLAGAIEHESVLLVGAARSAQLSGEDPVFPLIENDVMDEIQLESFGRSATRSLVERLLDERDVPGHFVAALHRQTGGNPLFVTESVEHLRDEGSVQPEYGIYPEPDEPFPVAAEVQETIDRRLASLDDVARTVVETGAVIGRTVPFDELLAATDLPEARLRDYIDALVEAGIFECESGTHRFRSEVVREVVLKGMDESAAVDRHRRAAEAIRETVEDVDEWATNVAEHYLAAGNDAAALEFFRRGGDHARDVYAHDVAREAYRAALDLARDLDRDETVIDLQRDLGRVNDTSGESEEALRNFRYVAEQVEDPELIRESHRYRSKINADLGRYDDAEWLADDGLAVGAADPTEERCRLLGMKGWVLLLRGELEGAETYFEREREMAATLDRNDLKAEALHELGTVRLQRGDVEKGIEIMERVVEIPERAENPHRLSASLNNLSAMYLKAGEVEPAVEALERAREIKERVGDPSGEMKTLGNLAAIEKKRGHWDTALEQYAETLERSELARDRQTSTIMHGNRAVLHLHRGAFDAAEADLEASLELADSIEDSKQIALVENTWAGLALLRGEPNSARSHAERALEVARAISDREAEAEAMAWIGRIALETGDPETALERHEEGLDIGTELGRVEIVHVHRLGLARANRHVGSTAAAIDHAETALESAREGGDPHSIAQAALETGACYRAAGNDDASIDALETAHERATSLGARVVTCRSHFQRGLIARERDDRVAAEGHLESALSLANDMGARLLTRKIEAALDDIAR
ncbi:MAG: tetratricopeptide (TPR) repeat protein [Halobacteriales archaeon]|jgi:tetratricopeptide (TPR) repeat protein